jgi:hypothetical protein
MFPRWEQNIPKLGMKRSQVGNFLRAFGGKFIADSIL